MKLLYLEWQDAHSYNGGWKSHDDIQDFIENQDFIVRQVGWLYAETPKMLVIVGTLRPEDDRSEALFGEIVKIPKTWIRKKVDLSKHVPKV